MVFRSQSRPLLAWKSAGKFSREAITDSLGRSNVRINLGTYPHMLPKPEGILWDTHADLIELSGIRILA